RTAIALRPALEGSDGAGTKSTPRPARRIGPADGDDFGHAHEQRARELAAVRDRRAPTRSRLGAWTLVRGTAADTLTALLASGEEEAGSARSSAAPRSRAPASPVGRCCCW